MKKAGRAAQVVVHLPSKSETQCSIPSTPPSKKKKERKEKHLASTVPCLLLGTREAQIHSTKPRTHSVPVSGQDTGDSECTKALTFYWTRTYIPLGIVYHQFANKIQLNCFSNKPQPSMTSHNRNLFFACSEFTAGLVALGDSCPPHVGSAMQVALTLWHHHVDPCPVIATEVEDSTENWALPLRCCHSEVTCVTSTHVFLAKASHTDTTNH
jgi:hypothetical protein